MFHAIRAKGIVAVSFMAKSDESTSNDKAAAARLKNLDLALQPGREQLIKTVLAGGGDRAPN